MHDHRTDVVIHIDEDLSDNAIHGLETELSQIAGVYSACVNDRARHLMLVDYDPEEIGATALLSAVKAQGVHAELIGL